MSETNFQVWEPIRMQPIFVRVFFFSIRSLSPTAGTFGRAALERAKNAYMFVAALSLSLFHSRQTRLVESASKYPVGWRVDHGVHIYRWATPIDRENVTDTARDSDTDVRQRALSDISKRARVDVLSVFPAKRRPIR